MGCRDRQVINASGPGPPRMYIPPASSTIYLSFLMNYCESQKTVNVLIWSGHVDCVATSQTRDKTAKNTNKLTVFLD